MSFSINELLSDVEGMASPELETSETHSDAVETGITSAEHETHDNWAPDDGAKTVPPPAKQRKPAVDKKSTRPVPPETTDPELRKDQLLVILRKELAERGIAGHHIESMNAFYSRGIRQIITGIYLVEGRLHNQRDATDEDRDIAEILFKIEFTDARSHSPTTKNRFGNIEMLMPNAARLRKLTYSCPTFIDAVITTTAVKKSGEKYERKREIHNTYIGGVPCALRTELCNTHGCSREQLKAMQEDPDFPGGTFIVRGEWAVDNTENLANNTFHVYNNMYANEITRGVFLSKPGDAYENSYQVLLRFMQSGAITMEVTIPKKVRIELPFYLIFRAVGMTRDQDIAAEICDLESQDPVDIMVRELLAKAFDADAGEFRPLAKTTDSAEILRFIGLKISEDAQKSQQAARRDDNVARYINVSLLNIIDRYIFPHIGTDPALRVKKMRFLGHLIERLLRVHLEIIDPTDRDDYMGKRVATAGVSLAKVFKTAFNLSVAQVLRQQFTNAFKSNPFSAVQVQEVFKAAINPDDIERTLISSITSGEKTITAGKGKAMIKNHMSTQTVYRKNDLNVKSILRTITTPNTGASKQNERADMMRRVQPSYPPFLDVSQSADSGESVGTKKQMAVATTITMSSSSFTVKDRLSRDDGVIPLDNITSPDIRRRGLAKIFVNGDWVGCCDAAHELVRRYRMLRRQGELHYTISIVWSANLREVYFWTDYGRLLRPAIIVYNNLAEYIKAKRARQPVKFRQWIRLTRAHISGLRTGNLRMEDLRNEGVIEYITPQEQTNAFIAASLDVLLEHAEDVTHPFTHMDIEQAIFGLVTMASPLSNHSSGIRNTYYTNQRKQTLAWFSPAYPYLMDKNTSLQWYAQRPLVSTFTDSITMPNGHTCIVAMMMYSGRNCEDSLILNQSSIDCGLFNASFYTTEQTELDKNEQFGNPDYARTMDIKKGAFYDSLDDTGFVHEGTIITEGTVLMSKVAKLPKADADYLYADRSIVYKKKEQNIVERVICTRNSEDIQIGRVKLRANRPLGPGGKCSCLTDDHEVMTSAGWKPIAEINLNDRVATLQDGILVYAEPSALHKYTVDTDLITVRNDSCSIRITPEHRMCIMSGGRTTLEPAADLHARLRAGSRHVQFLGTADWHQPDADNMDTLVQLFACWLVYGVPSSKTTGKTVGETSGESSFCCTADERDVIIELLSTPSSYHRYSYELYDKQAPDGRIWHITAYKLGPEFSSDAVNIHLPESFWTLSTRQCAMFFNALGFPGGDTFATRSKALVDDLMRLAVHAGYSGRVAEVCLDCDNAIIDESADSVSIECDYSHCKCWTFSVVGDPAATADDFTVDSFSGNVYCLTVPGEIFMVRRDGRACWTGNSRTGNKGICAATFPRCDMPYTEDGIVPDIIVNPHSIPTRMAVNQLAECKLGIVAALLGHHIDATAMNEPSDEESDKILEAHGIRCKGYQRLYNGRTGMYIDSLIFMGPTTYQRLQKFVEDDNYAIMTGPVNPVTHQAVEGRTNAGGLRLGEMEKDTLVAHGGQHLLGEKFYAHSSGHTIHICRLCGERAVVNEKYGIYKCKVCGDAAELVAIDSDWCSNQFFNENSAMNVKMTFSVEPHTYEQ